MARWLALAVSDMGDVKAAIVNDSQGTSLPHGDHSFIISRLDGCDELTALVSLPDDDFRPDVIDTSSEEEVPVTFIDL